MRRLAFALFLLFPIAACGQPARLEVKDVWARDTVGSTANAAVFMTITSPTPDRLIAASTPIAKKTDLMTMAGGSGAMEMNYLDGNRYSGQHACQPEFRRAARLAGST